MLAGVAAASGGDPRLLYQQAEQADGRAAVSLWRSLLEQSPEALAPEITSEAIRLRLIEDLIKAAQETGENAYYAQAMGSIRELSSTRNKAWSHVLLLRSQLLNDRSGAATGTYAEAVALLPELTSTQEHDEIAGGLVQALLTVRNGAPVAGRTGLEKARMLARFISREPYRADVQRDLAIAELLLDGQEDVKNVLVTPGPAAQMAFLRDRADAALTNGNDAEALRFALALPFESGRERDGLLMNISDKAAKAGEYALALKAVSGVGKLAGQGKEVLALQAAMIAAGELVRAEQLASMLAVPADAAAAWTRLAEAYHGLGYDLRAGRASAEMTALIPTIEDTAKRTAASASAARYLAMSGREEDALSVADQAPNIPARGDAYAWLALHKADAGAPAEAMEYFEESSLADAALRSRAAARIALAFVERKDPEEAADFLSDQEGLPPAELREARAAILHAFLARSETAEAEEFADDLADPASAVEAKGLLATHLHLDGKAEEADRQFTQIAADAKAISDDAERSRAYLGLAGAYIEAGRFEQAAPLIKGMQPKERQEAVALLTEGMARRGYGEQAQNYALKLPAGDIRDAALASLARELGKQQALRPAVTAAKQITQTSLRVNVFRDVAETQARQTDFYGLLQPDGAAMPNMRAVQEKEDSSMTLPASFPTSQEDGTSLEAFEEKTIDLVRSRNDDLLMQDAPRTEIGRKIPPIHEKQRLSYDATHVRKLVPASSRFRAARAYYMNSPYNLKFHFAAGNADFVRRQGTVVPDTITIESGVVDLSALHDYLQELGYGEYLSRESGRTYLLRRPLVIGPGASLVISAADTDELRMSVESGGYIVNSGDFYAVDVKLTGWSEQKQAPALVDKEPHEFRPFYATWSRSRTFMANTEQTALGYTNSKSYGMTISSGPRQFEKVQSRDYHRPTGILVDNSFRNFLYGFYSYEADNVVLVGNEYVDNMVYAIDPHDRSRWLTIAYNTTYDTHKKHGIIISREVNFSTILGNVTFANDGSGLMVDRFSTGSLIYANSSFDNGGDGLTVFESSCKLIASNRLFENKRAGIRVRNSLDVGIFFNEIRENRQAAVHGYVLNLKNEPAHRNRDFELDPYTDVTALSMVGNWIERNGVGIMGTDLAALYLRSNRFQSQSPKLMRGTWEKSAPRIFSSSHIEGDGLFITRRCVNGNIAVRHHCDFREKGYFPGDGQNNLIERIDENYCAQPLAPAQSAATVTGGNG